MNWQHFHYVDPTTGRIYEGPEGRREAFKPGGPLAQRLGCGRPTVLVIGSTMFVHAGMLPTLARRLDHISFDSDVKLFYLNALVRKWLLHNLSRSLENTKARKMIIDAPTDSNKTVSPFWTRIFGQIPINANLEDKQCVDAVKETLEVYKIGQLVVGHTPQMFTNKSGINGTCLRTRAPKDCSLFASRDANNGTCYRIDSDNPTLFRVDGGFAEAFNVFGNSHPIQVLEIINDKHFNILTEGSIANNKTASILLGTEN